jgi:hypothetical protein
MITKLTRFRLLGRGRGRGTRFDPTAAPCNDNQCSRRPAMVKRPPPRRVLLCRWHKTLSSTLECRWQFGSVADAASDGPGISWWRDWPVAGLGEAPAGRHESPPMQPLLQNVA